MASVSATGNFKKPKDKKGSKSFKTEDLYTRSLMNRMVHLPITAVGRNLAQTFSNYIKENYEGKCEMEGFIKPGSTNLIQYSAGKTKGEIVEFCIVFDCQVCYPVEGMKIQCKAINITKAGIRAESKEQPSPIVVFIARDHHYNQDYFNRIKEGDFVMVRVIGQRFELNDKYISIVGEPVAN